MTFRRLVLLLSAVLLTFDSVAMAQPLAVLGQKKTKAKKPSAKAERPAPDTTATGSDDADVERITVDDLKAKIAKNEPMTIIDDRSEGSFESSETQIKGSIRMTVDEIQSRLKEIPRNREIVTYCT
ncbi:MAG: rhodanese-like domain-containing protein [Acidobacteriota bacterium]